jgi:hypothetical protein
MLIAGGLLSTMLPPIGPAVEQLPATSQTVRDPVTAFAVSVPAGTEVVSVKLLSAEFAKPERPSFALHAMLTSLACQRPSVMPQLTPGAVLSIATANCLGDSEFPALSVAKNVTVVFP